MNTLILIPAYGRDYNSQKAVLDDWLSNKDFLIADIHSRYDGKPVDRDSLRKEGSYTYVNIRYNGLRTVVRIKVMA